jgi:hypothetical protein
MSMADEGGARTSETLIKFYQTTRRYNPEDSHLQFGFKRISAPDLCKLLHMRLYCKNHFTAEGSNNCFHFTVYQITDLLFIIIIGAGITVLLGLKTRTC